RRQRFLPGRADDDHAPQAALDGDRGPNAGAEPALAAGEADRPAGLGAAVVPGRTAGLKDDGGEVRPRQVPPAAHGEPDGRRAPRGQDYARTVVLVAAQDREIDRKQAPDLLGDRSEHLLWR